MKGSGIGTEPRIITNPAAAPRTPGANWPAVRLTSS